MIKLLVYCSIVLLVKANEFIVGTGIADVTGPSTEINFMGYALPRQRGSGIHLRLRARAFVVMEKKNPEKRMCFVSVDGGMGSDLVNMRVINKVRSELGDGLYTAENLAISGTHTHSGPAGFLQYLLYDMTSLGFVQETFEAWVDGISSAIVQAHRNARPGDIGLAQGFLFGSNINRSPTSYLLNPEEERKRYSDQGDTDKNMFLLRFTQAATAGGGDHLIGTLNWFAVHGTSMNNTNTLVSGDNRGYASYMLEREVNGPRTRVGHGPFVAAFASTNLGDVSPNTNGAKCIDTGEDCDGTTSTCNGRCEKCIAFGPGKNGDMFESTQIIGEKQYKHAHSLLGEAQEAKSRLSGVVDSRHAFVFMPALVVNTSSSSSPRDLSATSKLCSPAMGYAFAAGTTDGPGAFNFHQGTQIGDGSVFWNKVGGFLSKPTAAQKACQAPKPILLNTGEIDKIDAVKLPWDPTTVPIQILRIGHVFVLSVPGEFTTMAGRRLRAAVSKILAPLVVPDIPQVTIAGLTNTYSSYITTFEEYQAQRYEAASTIFGPHTLEGYIQEFSRLARDMVAGKPSRTDPPPPDLSAQLFELMPKPKFDRAPMGSHFGSVVGGKDVQPSYPTREGPLVEVTFHSANPRNNQRLEGTYLEVQRKTSAGMWLTVAEDGDWSTKFHWWGGPVDPLELALAHTSQARISWQVMPETARGLYRICHMGDHKTAARQKVEPFRGCSSEFQLV